RSPILFLGNDYHPPSYPISQGERGDFLSRVHLPHGECNSFCPRHGRCNGFGRDAHGGFHRRPNRFISIFRWKRSWFLSRETARSKLGLVFLFHGTIRHHWGRAYDLDLGSRYPVETQVGGQNMIRDGSPGRPSCSVHSAVAFYHRSSCAVDLRKEPGERGGRSPIP